jgi:hypothetical protein
MGDVIDMRTRRTRRTTRKSAPVVPIRKYSFDLYETPSGLVAVDAVVPWTSPW